MSAPTQGRPTRPAAPAARERGQRRVARLARVLGKVALWSVLVLVLLRVALGLALPWIVSQAGQAAGLELAYEDLSLSLLSGRVELWHLDLRVLQPEGDAAPTEDDSRAEAAPGTRAALAVGAGQGAEPDHLGHLEYLVADVDVSALFTGRVRVHRVEVDGLDVWATRDESGTWNFEALVGEPEPEEPDELEEPQPIELGSPVEVRAVRLQHVHLHLADRAAQPPVATDLELQVRLSDVGVAQRPLFLSLWASGPGLDMLRIEGHATSGGARLAADLDVRMRGLHPATYAAWLAPLGIEPRAETLAFDTDLTVDVVPAASEDPEAAYAVGATVHVGGTSLRADGEEELGIDAFDLAAPVLGAVPREAGAAVRGTQISIETAAVRGVRGRAKQRADGGLEVAGLVLRPVAAQVAQSEAPAETGTDEVSETLESAPSEAESGPALTAHIARLALEDVSFAFTDESVAPPAVLDLALVELAVTDLVLDPAQPEAPVALTCRLGAPGLFDELVLSGRATPFAREKSFALDLDVTGIAPERAAGWLAAAGLESTFESGHLAAHVEGSATLGAGDAGGARIAASLTDLLLSEEPAGAGPDGPAGPGVIELLALDALELGELTLDPATNTTRIANLELRGVRARLERDEEGALHFAGLRTQVSDTEPGSVSSSAPDTEPGSVSGGRLVVERVAWLDSSVTWNDRAPSAPVALCLTDLGFELEDFALGGTAGAGPVLPATLRLGAQALGLEPSAALGRFELAGTILSKPGSLDVEVDLELAGRELALAPLETYLRDLGLESRLAAGELTGHIAASLRAVPLDGEPGDALELSARVSDFGLVAGGVTWLGLDELAVPRARVTPSGTEVDLVRVAGPLVRARRAADGAFVFAETRLLQPTEDPVPAPVGAEVITAPATPPASSTPMEPQETAEPRAETTASVATSFQLGRFELAGARFVFDDAAVEPALATELGLDVELRDLALGGAPRTASFDVRATASGVLAELALAGTFVPDPDDAAFSATLSCAGLDGAPLAGYLPAGTTFDVEDGRLSLALEARARTLAAASGEGGDASGERREGGDAGEAGRAVRVALSDLLWRDGPDGPALLELERLVLDAPELGVRPPGAPSATYRVSELAAEGLALDAARTTPETLEVLGFTLALAPAPDADLASGPDESAERTEDADATRADVVPPTVVVEKLDLGLARFGFEDRTHAGAVPLEVSFRLRLPESTTLLVPEPESLGPIALEFTGRAAPICEEVDARLSLAPWLAEPEIDLDFALRGLSGRGLTDVLPELSEGFDGSELANGSFETGLSGVVRMRRRSPLDFDLSTGFGLELGVRETAWRAVPDGPVLLGFERLDVDVERIQPATGDVHVAEIELVTPIARLRQDTDGLHALGFVLHAPPASAEPVSVDPEAETRIVLASAPPASAGPADLAPPGPEFRLDRLVVGGLDFVFRDDSVQPPMIVPIDDLEVQVERFTTRGFTEPRPFQFEVSLYGGPVELSERGPEDSLLQGVFKSAGRLVGGSEEVETEERPAFDEITVSGRLALAPAPKGWVKLDVSALELPIFEGPAERAGLTIRDGIFDTTVEVRMRGDGGFSTSTRTTFDRLSLSEPPGGPLSRLLVLPAPLDTVLFVLRNPDGEQRISLDLAIPAEGISISNITAKATQTLAVIIADAISSSPFRILGGVVDLADFSEDEPVLLGEATCAIDFAPGATHFSDAAWAASQELVSALRQDPGLEVVVQHEISDGDYLSASWLANPSPEDCRALGETLRAQKNRLEARRGELAIDARRAVALGEVRTADDLAEQLQGIETELGDTEAALDVVYELLRPGAERRAPKRTRAACRAIAELRLEAVRAALLALPVARIAQRVDVRRARIELPPEDLEARVAADPTIAAQGGRITLTPKGRP